MYVRIIKLRAKISDKEKAFKKSQTRDIVQQGGGGPKYDTLN